MVSPTTYPRVTNDDYPALYTIADATSRLGQRNYLRLAKVDLLLLVVAAALGVIGARVPSTFAVWPLAGSTILLAATLIVRSASKTIGFDHDWFDGRVVAESVKTATWQYAMRVQPFDRDDPAAEAQFLGLLRQILDTHQDLRPAPVGLPADAHQVSARVRQIRELSLPERKACYLQQRVMDQITWYATRSEQKRRVALRWFWAELLARGVAFAFAIVVLVEPPSVPNFAGLVTALAAVITAWSQLGRNDELSKSYGVVAHELIMLKSALETADDDQQFGQVVMNIETAMSREHTTWLAKYT
jgi:hypothetical protein